MPETPKGLVYPDASGHTRLWEHLQELAESADEAITEEGAGLPVFASGTVNVVATNSGSGTAAVVFPAGRFTSPPVVVATVNGVVSGSHTGWYPDAISITAAGFSAVIMHKDVGGTGSANLVVGWIAVGV